MTKCEVKENNLRVTNPALAAEWHPEKNGELTPEMVTRGSHTKVWWKCKEGHEWEAVINNRSRRAQCPFCAGKKAIPGETDLATMHPALAAEWHPTKNGDLTPDMVTISSDKKVWWHGSCGHDWQAMVKSRSSGRNCPVCSNRMVVAGVNDLVTTNPVLAAEWHPTKNGTLTPEMVHKGSHKKVWWRCSVCEHEWQTQIVSRNVAGYGCPECSKGLHTSFKEKAIFLYCQTAYQDAVADQYFPWLTPGSHLDIYIPSIKTAIEYDGAFWHQEAEKDRHKNLLCAEHGVRIIRIREPNCPPIDGETLLLKSLRESDLEITIRSLFVDILNSRIVPDISLDRDRIKIFEEFNFFKKDNSLALVHPEIASQWHPTKNGNFTPEMITPGSMKKVWWLGRCGHEWEAPVADRVRKHGCPYCAGQRVLSGFNDLATKNPTLAAQWHPIKNGELTPEAISPGSGKTVWWLGECGHEWEMEVIKRSNGRGCPYCSKKNKHTIDPDTKKITYIPSTDS